MGVFPPLELQKFLQSSRSTSTMVRDVVQRPQHAQSRSHSEVARQTDKDAYINAFGHDAGKMIFANINSSKPIKMIIYSTVFKSDLASSSLICVFPVCATLRRRTNNKGASRCRQHSSNVGFSLKNSLHVNFQSTDQSSVVSYDSNFKRRNQP